MIQEYKIKPCTLCNQIHPLKVHSYPARSYINPEYEERKWIRIIVIICKIAKAQGEVFTKRLLPDFLVPFGVIRSDKVLDVLEKESISIEDASFILGCIDYRTVRKYLKNGRQAVRDASIALAERISHFPGISLERSFSPDTLFLTCFHSLTLSYNKQQIYLYGSRTLEKPVFHFLGVHWPVHSRKKPMTYVSVIPLIPDTG